MIFWVMSAERVCPSIWIRKVGLKVSILMLRSPVGPPEERTPPDTYRHAGQAVGMGFRG